MEGETLDTGHLFDDVDADEIGGGHLFDGHDESVSRFLTICFIVT